MSVVYVLRYYPTNGNGNGGVLGVYSSLELAQVDAHGYSRGGPLQWEESVTNGWGAARIVSLHVAPLVGWASPCNMEITAFELDTPTVHT